MPYIVILGSSRNVFRVKLVFKQVSRDRERIGESERARERMREGGRERERGRERMREGWRERERGRERERES